jgi:hypothetical protein
LEDSREVEDSREEVSQVEEDQEYASFIVEVEEGFHQDSPEEKGSKLFSNRCINPHLLQNKSESL